MLIAELANYLDDNDLGDYIPEGTGGDIFLHIFPPSPDDCIVIAPSSGAAPDYKHPYDTVGVQILTRSQSPGGGYQKAWDIYELLRRFGDGYLEDGGHHIVTCLVTSPPAPIGLDENSRHRFVLNMQFEIFTGGEDNEQQ